MWRRLMSPGLALLVSVVAAPALLARQPAAVVRQEIYSLADNSPTLVALRTAVQRMKALPRTDHRNWYFIANLHDFPRDAQGMPTDAADRTVPKADRDMFWWRCEHGTKFFLPWHRAELLTFEKIVRELSGDATFALPYWDAFANPQLPPQFRKQTVGGQPNPLYEADRGTGLNAGGAIDTLPGTVGPGAAVRAPQFFGSRPDGFAGNGTNAQSALRVKGFLESPAHDFVHGEVGGLMGSTETAARDPIFYLHHANIDRLWVVWRNGQHQDPTDQAWLNQSFVFPAPVAAQTASYKVADVRDTVALGYRYDNDSTALTQNVPPAPAPAPAPAPGRAPAAQAREPIPSAPPARLTGRAINGGLESTGPAQLSILDKPLELRGESMSIDLPVTANASQRMRAIATGASRGTATPQSVDLVLRGVTAARNPGAGYLVYANLPAAPGARGDAATYFVGLLSSWEVSQANHPGMNDEIRYALGDTVSRLITANAWNAERVRISFVRSGIRSPTGTLPPTGDRPLVSVKEITLAIR